MRNFLAMACRMMLLTLIFCASLHVAFAQDTTGTINGTVTDTAGAAVSGATVTITDEDKKIVVRTVTTGDVGQYSIPQLPVATYTVTVESANFKKSAQTGIKLDVNQRRTVDLALEAGNISEVVTVEADPVAVELTTPTASTVINGNQVRELSVNNRNFVQLVTLAPGVTNDLSDQVYVGTTNPAGQANTVNISVNGSRSSQNTFTVDGSDITDRGSNLTIQTYPSIDSIGEFKVLRSLYPAESGSSGGGQVNIITRSGSDGFHGSFFEFVRNERLNANDFLTNASITPPFGRDSNGKAKRSPFRYNDYGFTIGGPIYVPNFHSDGVSLFNRVARTFFFFSEEQRKDIRYPTLIATVPDANLRQGIFPIDVCINRNNTTDTCTGANILKAGTPLPAALFNSAAQSYINQIYNKLPLPNGANYALTSAARNVSDFRQEIVRLDHTFTDKLSVFYRYEHDKIPTLDVNSLFSSGGSLPGVSTTETDSPGRTHTIQGTYALSSSAVIEGRYTYAYGAILSHNTGLLALANSTNPVTLPYTNTRDRITSVSGNGFSGLTSFGPYDNFSNKNGFAGNLSLIQGRHTFKFGMTYSRYRKNENALVGDATGGNQGIFTAFSTTLPTGITASTLNQNLQRFANFLVGNASTFVQGKFDYTADLRQSNIEAFAQDEWRFRKNLTLYYGVRYSRFGQPFDKNGRLSNFVPSLFNASAAPLVTGAGVRVAGSGNFCNGIVVNSQNAQTLTDCTPIVSPFGQEIARTPGRDFAPRVGLAWDPFGNGRTSIRTGYGIYHEQVLAGFDEQIIGVNPPYQQNATVTNTRLDNPGAGPNPVGVSIRGVDTNWHTPYTQQWSLDVQHQFTSKMVGSVGYYGSKGTHLVGVVEINELSPNQALNSRCAPGASTTATAGVTLVPCQPASYAFSGTSSTTAAVRNPNVLNGVGSIDYLILDQLRPYRGYRSITLLEPRFNSNYHSLQASLTQRFTGDSQLQVAYTFSKNLTDSQNDRSNAPQNSADIRSEYSRATLDRRHVLTLNYVYELPFLRKQEGFVGKVLGGWQSSGIITAQSGLPFTITTSSLDAAGLGLIPAAIAGARPNLLCDPNTNEPGTRLQYFNTQCFQTNPAAGAIVSTIPGTAGRGIVDGPPTYRVDFTMTKNIRFSEKTRLQLRGEAFNVFNHTNFRTIGTNVTLGTYGTVTAVRDPRNIQLGIKLYF